MKNLTTIHTLPKGILGEVLELYDYNGNNIADLFLDLLSVVKETPERLLHLEVLKEDYRQLCVEAGLSYQTVYKEFLLTLSWLHLLSKPHKQKGLDLIDIAITENLDVILYYQPSSNSQTHGNRVGWFRYHLPFQSLYPLEPRS